MFTPTETNRFAATAAQIVDISQARQLMRGWSLTARLYHAGKNGTERDKCIARAKCFQARVRELTQDGKSKG